MDTIGNIKKTYRDVETKGDEFNLVGQMMSYCSKYVATQWVEEIVRTVKMVNLQTSDRAYIQLAMRTGQYKTINAIEVYDGEIISTDRLTGEVVFQKDQDLIDFNKVVGYMAYFKMLNGFEKTIYWTKEKMEVHAKTYSQTYSSKKKEVVDKSLWATNFDDMAIKTMLKRLLGKYGILSLEMQTALAEDNQQKDSVEYVDKEVKEEITQNANKKTIDIEPQQQVIEATFKEQVQDDGPGF